MLGRDGARRAIVTETVPCLSEPSPAGNAKADPATRCAAMKYLQIVKQLTFGEIVSIAVVVLAPIAILYGLLT
jgi:hypothetical protein